MVFSHALNFDDDFPEYETTTGVWRGADPRQVSSSPLMWADALDRMLGLVAAAPGVDVAQIRAISGAAQQHGSVYLGPAATATFANLDASQPLAPQLTGVFSRAASPVWMDESTTDQCLAIEAALGGADACAASPARAPTSASPGRRFAASLRRSPRHTRARAHSPRLVLSRVASDRG